MLQKEILKQVRKSKDSLVTCRTRQRRTAASESHHCLRAEEPATLSEQFMYDKGTSVKENVRRFRKSRKKNAAKERPCTSRDVWPERLKQEGARGQQEKQLPYPNRRISVIFKVSDIDSAKKSTKDVLN